jgi:hypothetical protein
LIAPLIPRRPCWQASSTVILWCMAILLTCNQSCKQSFNRRHHKGFRPRTLRLTARCCHRTALAFNYCT